MGDHAGCVRTHNPRYVHHCQCRPNDKYRHHPQRDAEIAGFINFDTACKHVGVDVST